MPVREIKTKLELDGEKEFEREISSAARNLRVMGSELKRASAEYDATGDRAAYLTTKSATLKNQIAQQKEIFEALSKAIESSAQSTGEASTKTDGYRIRLNNAAAAMAKMEREAADADRELEELGRDSAKVGRQIEDGITDAAQKAGRSLDDMYEKLQSDIGSIKNSTAVSAVMDLGGAIGDTWQAMDGFTEGARDYNRQMSYLEQNTKDAKLSFDDVKNVLIDAIAITGDADGAFEGVSNLLATGFDTSEMKLAIESLAGAVIAFPETMKFENLAESLQESVATGEATGAFAELMDRMGVSTEDFAAAMEAATSEEEKQQVALSFLNRMGLRPTAEAYREANEEMIEAAKSSAILDDAWSNLAKTIDEKLTPVRNKMAELVSAANTFLTDGFAAGATAMSKALDMQYTEEELEAAAKASAELRNELEELDAQIITAFSEGNNTLGWELTEKYNALLDKIAEAEQNAMDEIVKAGKETGQEAGDASMTALTESVTDNMQTASAAIGDSGSRMVKAAADGMTKAGEKELESAAGVIGGIGETFNDAAADAQESAGEMMRAIDEEIRTQAQETEKTARSATKGIARGVTSGFEEAAMEMNALYTDNQLAITKDAAAQLREEYDAIEEEIIGAYMQGDTRRALELIAKKSEIQKMIATAEKDAITDVGKAMDTEDGAAAAEATLERTKEAIKAGAKEAQAAAREDGHGITQGLAQGVSEGTKAGIDAAGSAVDEVQKRWKEAILGVETSQRDMMNALEEGISADGKRVAQTAAESTEEITQRVTGGLKGAESAMRSRYTQEELEASKTMVQQLREEFYVIEEEILDAYAQSDGKRAQELIARKQELQNLIIEAEQNAINEIGRTGSEGGAQAGGEAMAQMQQAIIDGAPLAEETARTAGQNTMTALANGVTEYGAAAVSAVAEVVSAINATFSQIAMPSLDGVSSLYYSTPRSVTSGTRYAAAKTNYTVTLNVDGKKMASVVTPHVSSALASSASRYAGLA